MEYTINKGNILELSYKKSANNTFNFGGGSYCSSTETLGENFTLFDNCLFGGEKGIYLENELGIPSMELQLNIGKNDIPFFINPNNQLLSKNGGYNLLFMNGDKTGITLNKSSYYKTFDIHLPISKICKYFGNNRIIDKFINNINSEVPATLFDEYRPIPHKIYQLINDIRECNISEFTKSDYIEIKIQEIFLILISDSHFAEQIGNKKIKISSVDKEMLFNARKIIEDNIENPLTIIELSKIVGMNDYKLKILFKHFFGCTVFEYLQSYRMNKAKEYLKRNQLSITEIAYKLGYSNSGNFSNAYKHYWGITPSKE